VCFVSTEWLLFVTLITFSLWSGPRLSLCWSIKSSKCYTIQVLKNQLLSLTVSWLLFTLNKLCKTVKFLWNSLKLYCTLHKPFMHATSHSYSSTNSSSFHVSAHIARPMWLRISLIQSTCGMYDAPFYLPLLSVTTTHNALSYHTFQSPILASPCSPLCVRCAALMQLRWWTVSVVPVDVWSVVL
jgi:hypothetical protein